MSGRLAGKVALITGTGGGQGRAAAELFAAEGACVVGCDTKAADGEETVRRVTAAGGKMVSRVVDLGDEDQARSWIDFAVDTYGDFDILYNNAAAARYGRMGEFTTDDWRFVVRNELDLVYYVTKYAHPVMKRRGGGSIVSTASAAGLSGSTFGGHIYEFAHSMAKGGIIAMSRNLAVEFAPDNIRVNSISPGLVETPAFALIPEEARNNMVDDIMELLLIKRPGQGIDIAYCALYLASDESSYVTGQNFSVDGGFTAQ